MASWVVTHAETPSGMKDSRGFLEVGVFQVHMNQDEDVLNSILGQSSQFSSMMNVTLQLEYMFSKSDE